MQSTVDEEEEDLIQSGPTIPRSTRGRVLDVATIDKEDDVQSSPGSNRGPQGVQESGPSESSSMPMDIPPSRTQINAVKCSAMLRLTTPPPETVTLPDSPGYLPSRSGTLKFKEKEARDLYNEDDEDRGKVRCPILTTTRLLCHHRGRTSCNLDMGVCRSRRSRPGRSGWRNGRKICSRPGTAVILL